jgi:hypothetical protein
MSRKNLAKTVIEGGRVNSNKWDRRHSSKEERVRIKQYLHEVLRDIEHADEIVEPEREHVYKEFNDKLGPMYRWIESQVGRPWSEVRSEIFEKFDARTTAGRHILFDHLLSSIVDTESGFNQFGYLADPSIPTVKEKPYSYRSFYQEYFVNEEGILCKTKEYHKMYRKIYEHVTEEEYRAAGEWLAGRIITEKEGVLYWCLPTDGLWKSSWLDLNGSYDPHKGIKLKYYLFDNGLYQLPGMAPYVSESSSFTGRTHGDHWEYVEHPFSFRQRGPLDEEEIKAFKSLKKKLQRQILEFGKGR